MLCITKFGFQKLSGQGKSFSTPSLLFPQRIHGKFKTGAREKLQRHQKHIPNRGPVALRSGPGFEEHTDSSGNETKQTIDSLFILRLTLTHFTTLIKKIHSKHLRRY